MTAKPTSGMASPHKIFSHPVHVAGVPESGLDISIEADAATLQALAVANGLPKITQLAADFHIVPRGNARFNVSGEVRAGVTQICSVSLEPFDSDLVESIDVDFAPAAEAAQAAAAFAALMSSDAVDVVAGRDPPDPIIDGKIDLGTLAVEFLALGLDPYPRKPGRSFEPAADQAAAAGTEDAEENPFSVLRKLKEGP